MTTVFAALGALSGWAWAAAGCVGLAAFWLVGPRPGITRADDSVRGSRGGPVTRPLTGRSDAAPLSRRLLLGLVVVLPLGVLGVRLAPGLTPWIWAVAPGLTLATAVGLGWLEPGAARQRRQRLVLEAPQALELLASCLAAGLPVRAACRAVVAAFDGPVAEDLGRVTALTALGVNDAEAWAGLAAHPVLGPAAGDLARSVESGTMLVDGLRHHAVRARERRRGALQVAARSVGVRSVLPLMACFIPSFMLIGVVPSVASALTHALQF